MNLSTAKSAERAKEVGVRKVMGAGKGKLVWQFIGESLVLSLCYLGGTWGLYPVFGAAGLQPVGGKAADNGLGQADASMRGALLAIGLLT